MKFFLSITVLFFFIPSFGQKTSSIKIKKEPIDTIDYFYINYKKGYHLKKVQGKSSQLTHFCNKQLNFSLNDTSRIQYFNQQSGSGFNLGDTLMAMTWYVKSNNHCLAEKCIDHGVNGMGKLSINKKTNTIVLEKKKCFVDKDTGKYSFKVVKFSEYEIKLLDLQKNSKVEYNFIRN